MNNTLTGLGLALVLALLAALIGPYFVNWTAYRDDFAAQASALIGAPVKVSGAVDVRLLPSPYIRFRDLTAGGGEASLSVAEIEIELGIGPLMRGEYKAERVKIIRPSLVATLKADGTVATPFSKVAKGEADRISFDRADIVDGAISLSAPGRRMLAVNGIAGTAEAGSLKGPFKFEGAAGWSGERAKIRASTARLDANGVVRVKVNVTPETRPETLDLDGALTVAAKPVFDGGMVLARPARKGREGEPDRPQWRTAARVKADAARVALTDIDFAYGPDDRAIRLGGRGSLDLGEKPRFDLALDARQIDLDRFAGEGRPKTPGSLLAAFTPKLAAIAAPGMDGRVSLDVRGVVLAGDVVQGLKAELASNDGQWRVENASAEMPAGTTVALSGAVAFADTTPGFAGHVDFASSDLSGFRQWLDGGERAGGAPIRKFSLKGEVIARPDEASIEKATLSADGAASTGRLAWRAGDGGSHSRIEAALTSEKLDLDALGAERLVSAALKNGAGGDLALTLDAKSLVYGGVAMKDVAIEGLLDANGIDLKRLSVGDAQGATLAGGGQINARGGAPEGKLDFEVDAVDLAPLVSLARSAGAPEQAVAAIERRETALAPVKLSVEIAADKDGRRLTAKGEGAGGTLDVKLSAAEFSADADARVEASVASDDGHRLAGLLGLEISPVVEAAGGEVSLKLSGAPSKGMTGEGRFVALGLDLSGRGVVAFAPEVGFNGSSDVSLKSEDLTSFGEAIGRLTPGDAPAVPAELTGRLKFDRDQMEIADISGVVSGRQISGRVTLPSDLQKGFAGEAKVTEFPLSTFIALALAPSAGGTPASSVWPTANFGPSPLRGLAGRIDVKADKVPLAGGQTATDTAFALVVRPNAIGFENISAALDGGKLAGAVHVSRAEGDATINVAGTVEGVRAEQLLGLAPSTKGLSGLMDVKLEGQGTGKSLAAVVAAFNGAGSATLRDGAIAGLDVAAIDAIEPEIEKGLELDAPKIASALDKKLASADLALKRLSAPFTVSGGVLRSGGLSSESDAAKVGGGVIADLSKLTLDADLTLAPNRPDAPQIGVSYDGLLAAPTRKVDATSLTSWLSVRAVERETKRIEAMEADTKERARVAREKAEADRKKAEEAKRKADEERRKREAEAKALQDALPKPAPNASPVTQDGSPPSTQSTDRSAPKPPAAPRVPEKRDAISEALKKTEPAPSPAPLVITPPGGR